MEKTLNDDRRGTKGDARKSRETPRSEEFEKLANFRPFGAMYVAVERPRLSGIQPLETA